MRRVFGFWVRFVAGVFFWFEVFFGDESRVSRARVAGGVLCDENAGAGMVSGELLRAKRPGPREIDLRGLYRGLSRFVDGGLS